VYRGGSGRKWRFLLHREPKWPPKRELELDETLENGINSANTRIITENVYIYSYGGALGEEL
jgi:hypothetical protein